LQAATGAVVNICDAGVYRPWRHYTPYLTTKGALVTMTTALARELAPDIRVNGVAPGLVLPAADWQEPQIQRVVNAVPLRRVGTAADVAEAVLFLASAPYISGVILPVDGGLTR
jgi:pteridine reductase